MFETTIAGICCSKVFVANTKVAPALGSLIRCKHCDEIIELSYSNSITTDPSESSWLTWKYAGIEESAIYVRI
jgi:hypothetical protein